MCGIAGMVSRQPLRAEQIDALARMSQALVHRGPDGVGDYRTDRIALTMRRLSIIDLTTGFQPLFDEEETLVLVANGEIYNYVELREQLRARGHRFRTGSDCETIVHLYQEHGVDCVHHLRGMFAFALWDRQAGRLLLARDRMGEKPLYLHETEGFLAFGSELKTLLQSGLVPFKLDPAAIDQFFHYHYVPEPATPIQGVRKLQPGHLLTVQIDPWTVTDTCYWSMESAPALDGDPVRLIRGELETISSLVIRSDVPVGIALSGGLDSSAIAVLAARNYPGKMNAFSVGYAGRPPSDERHEAQALARQLQMPFHEIELRESDVVEGLPELVRWQDDPIADVSGFGYWAVAKEARRQGVPVLLQGQGGDELFWGYPWVARAARQSARKARRGHGTSLLDYIELTPPTLWPRRAPIDWILSLGGLRTSLAAYLRDHHSPADRLVFFDMTEQFRVASELAGQIYPREFREALGAADPRDLFAMPLPWSNIDVAITRLICQTYLLENGIAQGDRLSMAASVELRLPLVDHRLVEIVVGLRKARSDVDLPPKHWLRQAVSDLLPEAVLSRRKRGFQPPVRDWHPALFARHGHLLEEGMLVQCGVLTAEAARAFAKGRYPLTVAVPSALNALVLEIWCRQASGGIDSGRPAHPVAGATSRARM